MILLYVWKENEEEAEEEEEEDQEKSLGKQLVSWRECEQSTFHRQVYTMVKYCSVQSVFTETKS